MKCVNCGGTMKAVTGTHRYTESGLSSVTLVGVVVRTCPDCGEREISIPRVETLHKMIARAIIKSPSALTPEEIRYLRKWLGYASADFALVMGVRPETVSRWENKEAAFPMAPTADKLLRVLVATREPVDKYPIDLLKTPTKAKAEPLRLRAPDWKRAVS